MSDAAKPTKPGISEPLRNFYAHLFEAMEILIGEHQSFGNWAVGGIPDLRPQKAQKSLGLWYADGAIPGIAVPGAVSLALVPGDTRVGLFLPCAALQGKNGITWLEDVLAQSFNGERCSIVRRDANQVLFDYHFSGEPFDPASLHAAMLEPDGPMAQILAQRLAYTVSTLWVNAIRVLYADGKVGSDDFLVRSMRPLAPDDLQGLPSGVLVQSNEIGDRVYVSYIRAQATEAQILDYLRKIGVAGDPLTVERLEESAL